MRQSIWTKLAIDQLKEINIKRASLANVEKRLTDLKMELDGIKATVASLAKAVGGELNKQERWIIDSLALQRELEVSRSQLKLEIESFDKAWKGLTEQEQRVLDRFYVNRAKDYIERLCEEFSCEKSKVYQIKDEALYRFSMFLYGRY